MKKYLITSREFYTDTPAIFRAKLHQQFVKHLPDFALFRDKTNQNYATQAEHFVEVCSQFEDVKAFIHQDYNLARRLNARGVHLTSTAFDDIAKAKELGLEVVISAHTHEEVLNAQRLGADYVTYSPIFSTPNKGEPKGVDDLKKLLEKTNVKVFALGGVVDEKQIGEIEKTASYGFASIRYFY